MSNTIVLPDRSSARLAAPHADDVVRMPFYLESQGQPCFAWLHRREHTSCTAHGILICPPIGHEQIHSHRSLRHLADALARSGLSVVRFDYHGTGDSGGSDEDGERVAAWLANIRDGHDWLRQQLGCRRISLVGLRVGAALAVQAAAELPVDGLLLWAPVIKGRSYVREMNALSLTGAAQPSATSAEGIEAAGFVLTGETARDLSDVDLLRSRPLCRRALVLTRDDGPGDERLLRHLQALGIETRQAAAPGYADMMAEPHYSQVPRTAIAQIIEWLEEDATAGETTAEAPRPHAVESVLLPEQRIRERAVHLSQQPRLFGILSEPATAPREDVPVVVLVNAGSSYRVGPNRLYVTLARQLAVQGFRSLRLDLCGLGDSVSPNSERENDPYPATAFRDVDLALRYLQTHLAARRVVLMGLCSGAYAAFQSAVQLASPVLVESVLINPLTFFWREGMSLEVSAASQLRSFQAGLASLRRPSKWLKLLSGRSKMGIAGAVRMLFQRWRLGCLARRRATLASARDHINGSPAHPQHEDLPGDLERAARSGRHLAFFFARSDPGHALLLLGAKHQVHELGRAGRLSLHFIEDADHTFSRRHSRRALAQRVAEHLAQRYLPPAAGV
jgi:alpha/beta superfamily hydrolase